MNEGSKEGLGTLSSQDDDGVRMTSILHSGSFPALRFSPLVCLTLLLSENICVCGKGRKSDKSDPMLPRSRRSLARIGWSACGGQTV